MSLYCDYDSDGDHDWYFMPPDDFTKLATKRSRKCVSCGAKIKPGDDCCKFPCSRNPRGDIEERIHGDEVALATKYLCEECGGVYLSAVEVGYCYDLDGDIRQQVREL